MSMYKNGHLVKMGPGWEPRTLTRTLPYIGKSAWDSDQLLHGTVAFVNVYHGVALDSAEVAELYVPYKLPSRSWDFAGCTEG